MDIINLLDQLKEDFLIESGIKIPKNTKAAKIIYHQDTDGIFSAMLTYRQLIKQGIPAKNIKLSSIQYGMNNKEVEKKLSAKKGQMVALVDFARLSGSERTPDFWSDHHIADEKMKGGKSGKIGKTEYGSEAEHLATAHAQNIADPKTIKMITMIDSAQYPDLEAVLKLPKNFKEKGRLERLAVLTQALLADSGVFRNESLAKKLIRESKPSIVSIYNTAKELARLSNLQKVAIKELEKEKPDWDTVNKIRNKLLKKVGKEAAEKVSSSKQPARSRLNEAAKDELEKEDRIDELENKKKKGNLTDAEKKELQRLKTDEPIGKVKTKREGAIKKHTQKSKTGFKQKGSMMNWSAGQVQRYLWTQLHEKGVRSPFVIRNLGPGLQISINPDLPKEVKETVNLEAMMKGILKKVKEEIGGADWAWNVIMSESGGHKGITNISALNLLGLMPKKYREELKEIEGYEQRIKNMKTRGTSSKLDERQKAKLKRAKELIKKVENLGRYTPEEEAILRRAADAKGLTDDVFKSIEIMDKYKEKKIVGPKRSKDPQVRGNPQNYHIIKVDTKVHPVEVDNYKKAMQTLVRLKPTLKNLMPKKAERKEELEKIKNKYKKQTNEVRNRIKELFQKELDELAKQFPPLKGKEEFQIKDHIIYNAGVI